MTIGEIAEAAAARLKRSLPVLAAEGEAVRAKRRAVHFAAEPWQVPPDAPLPGLIDYTLLEAKATATDIEQLCRVALTHSFRAVCVNPLWIDLAASVLRGSDVRVVSTVGFPLGAQRSLVKAVEAAEAVSRGAQEIDMVIPLGALLAGDLATVYEDIAAGGGGGGVGGFGEGDSGDGGIKCRAKVDGEPARHVGGGGFRQNIDRIWGRRRHYRRRAAVAGGGREQDGREGCRRDQETKRSPGYDRRRCQPDRHQPGSAVIGEGR